MFLACDVGHRVDAPTTPAPLPAGHFPPRQETSATGLGRLQRLWDSIHRRLADLAACRVMPPHVDRYEREQRLFGMLDTIEYRTGVDWMTGDTG